MKLRTFCLLIPVCMLTGMGPSVAALPGQNPSFGKYRIPVHEEARNLKEDVNRNFERADVSYELSVAFPAEGIIAFHENAFKQMGFIPDPEEGYPMRRWEKFDGKAREWRGTDEIPARYVATWVDRERKVRSLLVLRYGYKEGDKDGADALHVDCSFQRLFGVWDLCRFH